MTKRYFPRNFLWGASISSHQVEGNVRNDWSEWEVKNAKELAGRSGKSVENHISGRACDHYNLYEQDFDIAKQLNLNAFRFSIEWSRIEPEKGYFDEKEIAHYKKYITSLKERGLEPILTLWHYTNPVWFANEGGWSSKNAVFYFTRYAERIVNELKDDLQYILTINEPDAFTFNHSRLGPPQKRNPIDFYRTYSNLISAHNSAYASIKEIKKTLQVGSALNIVYLTSNPIAKPLRIIWDKVNYSFLDRMINCQDFIGLNYYFHIPLNFSHSKNNIKSDVGWELCPEGLYHILKHLQKYEKPIFITEHGLADAGDKYRADYIKESLLYVLDSIEEGVDVRGYFHWSLIDNFEWNQGFWPRFGLAEVNYKTLERKLRKSALYYSNICKTNCLDG